MGMTYAGTLRGQTPMNKFLAVGVTEQDDPGGFGGFITLFSIHLGKKMTLWLL